MANVILAQDVHIRRKYFSSSKQICYFLSVDIKSRIDLQYFGIMYRTNKNVHMLFFDTFYVLFYFLPYYIIAN